MKFYSEKLNKLFDSAEALEKAESELEAKERRAKELEEKKASERKVLAKEVEDAYRAYKAAQKAYDQKLLDFIEKYGSFHMTITEPEGANFKIKNWDFNPDLFNKLFKF